MSERRHSKELRGRTGFRPYSTKTATAPHPEHLLIPAKIVPASISYTGVMSKVAYGVLSVKVTICVLEAEDGLSSWPRGLTPRNTQ